MEREAIYAKLLQTSVQLYTRDLSYNFMFCCFFAIICTNSLTCLIFILLLASHLTSSRFFLTKDSIFLLEFMNTSNIFSDNASGLRGGARNPLLPSLIHSRI